LISWLEVPLIVAMLTVFSTGIATAALGAVREIRDVLRSGK